MKRGRLTRLPALLVRAGETLDMERALERYSPGTNGCHGLTGFFKALPKRLPAKALSDPPTPRRISPSLPLCHFPSSLPRFMQGPLDYDSHACVSSVGGLETPWSPRAWDPSKRMGVT